eukprot:scaffold56975_cov30-Prasinocladus_malaysianus.AAC.2
MSRESHQVYVRNAVFGEATCRGASTVYIQGGTTLLVNSDFFCADDQLVRAQGSPNDRKSLGCMPRFTLDVVTDAASGSLVFNVPTAATVAKVTFDASNTTVSSGQLLSAYFASIICPACDVHVLTCWFLLMLCWPANDHQTRFGLGADFPSLPVVYADPSVSYYMSLPLCKSIR